MSSLRTPYCVSDPQIARAGSQSCHGCVGAGRTSFKETSAAAVERQRFLNRKAKPVTRNNGQVQICRGGLSCRRNKLLSSSAPASTRGKVGFNPSRLAGVQKHLCSPACKAANNTWTDHAAHIVDKPGSASGAAPGLKPQTRLGAGREREEAHDSPCLSLRSTQCKHSMFHPPPWLQIVSLLLNIRKRARQVPGPYPSC